MLHAKFYEADLSDWDIIMGYDFMVSNSVGALPHRAALIREASQGLSWVSTHYTPGGSQWTRDEEEKIVRAVKAAGIKSKGGGGEHLQEYGLSQDAYCRMMEDLGMDTPSTDVFTSKEAPKFQKCARYWHNGDSVWNKHWGAEEWGHLYVHGGQRDSEPVVNKIIADRAKGVLVLTGPGSGDVRGEVLRSNINLIALNEFVFVPDEEIFMDATGTSLPSPRQAWSTHAHYVDGAQCHPTGDEALIRIIQAVPMRVMSRRARTPKWKSRPCCCNRARALAPWVLLVLVFGDHFLLISTCCFGKAAPFIQKSSKQHLNPVSGMHAQHVSCRLLHPSAGVSSIPIVRKIHRPLPGLTTGAYLQTRNIQRTGHAPGPFVNHLVYKI